MEFRHDSRAGEEGLATQIRVHEMVSGGILLIIMLGVVVGAILICRQISIDANTMSSPAAGDIVIARGVLVSAKDTQLSNEDGSFDLITEIRLKDQPTLTVWRSWQSRLQDFKGKRVWLWGTYCEGRADLDSVTKKP